MANSEDQMDKHLQSAIFGAPVLHPDEQHRNLGTFHERIDVMPSNMPFVNKKV